MLTKYASHQTFLRYWPKYDTPPSQRITQAVIQNLDNQLDQIECDTLQIYSIMCVLWARVYHGHVCRRFWNKFTIFFRCLAPLISTSHCFCLVLFVLCCAQLSCSVDIWWNGQPGLNCYDSNVIDSMEMSLWYYEYCAINHSYIMRIWAQTPLL